MQIPKRVDVPSQNSKTSQSGVRDKMLLVFINVVGGNFKKLVEGEEVPSMQQGSYCVCPGGP